LVGGIRPESLHAAQDEIALAIVDTLKARLLIGEREALTKRHTDDSELLRLYLLGRHHWHRFTPEDFELSEGYMEQALDKDPDFAMAHVGIAEVNHVKPFFMAAGSGRRPSCSTKWRRWPRSGSSRPSSSSPCTR
jgi:hypothetical protein